MMQFESRGLKIPTEIEFHFVKPKLKNTLYTLFLQQQPKKSAKSALFCLSLIKIKLMRSEMLGGKIPPNYEKKNKIK